MISRFFCNRKYFILAIAVFFILVLAWLGILLRGYREDHLARELTSEGFLAGMSPWKPHWLNYILPDKCAGQVTAIIVPPGIHKRLHQQDLDLFQRCRSLRVTCPRFLYRGL